MLKFGMVKRQSSAEAYLKYKPKNLTIYKNTSVIKILFEKSKAIGLLLSKVKFMLHQKLYYLLVLLVVQNV